MKFHHQEVSTDLYLSLKQKTASTALYLLYRIYKTH